MKEGKEVTTGNEGWLASERMKRERKASDVKITVEVGEVGQLAGNWQQLTGCREKTWERESDFLNVSEIGGKRDKR